MTPRRGLLLAFLFLGFNWALAAQTLPERLTDQDFWKLVSDLSEPPGTFRFDNLVSNEGFFQYVLPELVASAKPEGVYLGVGPEQNFTFISALRPKMAFIVDIRRGNLDLQLMYKALFELSPDRADFVSRLFCRPRPAGLTTESTVDDIFAAYGAVPRSDALYRQTLKDIQDHLTETRGLPLTADHLTGIEYVYRTLCQFGPQIHFHSSARAGIISSNRITFAELMTSTDQDGHAWSFLAQEDNFLLLRNLQLKNLVIPVVGDFAGDKAIRAIAKYLKDANSIVSAFYVSNVEEYLYPAGVWNAFCANAATLPLDSSSTFIRAGASGRFGTRDLKSDLGTMLVNLEACSAERISPARAR